MVVYPGFRSRLIAFASGGATIAIGQAIATHYGFKPFPLTPTESPAPNQPSLVVPWSDSSKYTRSPPAFSTGGTIFSFAESSGHFFAYRRKVNDSSAWAYSSYIRKDSTLASNLSQGIGTLYFAAFTPYGDELVVFKDSRRADAQWAFHFNPHRYAQASNYTSLIRWLDSNVSAGESSLLRTWVVFGKGSTCFARSASSCFWQDLPARLENVLLEKKLAYSTAAQTKEKTEETKDENGWIPRLVALGANETFVAIWEDGRFVSSLSTDNRLMKNLDIDTSEIPTDSWENIVLSPHQVEDYFMVNKLGHIDMNISKTESAGATELISAINAYTQLRAKETGVTFQNVATIDKDTLTFTVSPDSDMTERKTSAMLRESSQSLLSRTYDSVYRLFR